MGISGTDTPLQGASKTDKPTAEEGLAKERLHPAKKTLSGCTIWTLKKARESEVGTGNRQRHEI
jgi:hypothetical protein